MACRLIPYLLLPQVAGGKKRNSRGKLGGTNGETDTEAQSGLESGGGSDTGRSRREDALMRNLLPLDKTVVRRIKPKLWLRLVTEDYFPSAGIIEQWGEDEFADACIKTLPGKPKSKPPVPVVRLITVKLIPSKVPGRSTLLQYKT